MHKRESYGTSTVSAAIRTCSVKDVYVIYFFYAGYSNYTLKKEIGRPIYSYLPFELPTQLLMNLLFVVLDASWITTGGVFSIISLKEDIANTIIYLQIKLLTNYKNITIKFY